jgi:predicted nucleic-acid-binding protein
VIGIDTNILIRFIVQDDAVQTRQVDALLQARLSADDRGFVSLVTIVEVVWVLRRFYAFSAQQIASAVETILLTESLELQNRQEVYIAMLTLKSGLGSFDDALIAALGTWAGCDRTLTFDRKAQRLPGFELL